MLSECMAINADGKLIYIGHKGKIYEVVGGTNGQINLKKIL